MIRINGTFINVAAIALAEQERAINGELRLKVAFLSGSETRFSGAKAAALLGHLEATSAEPMPAPGLRTGEDDGP